MSHRFMIESLVYFVLFTCSDSVFKLELKSWYKTFTCKWFCGRHSQWVDRPAVTSWLFSIFALKSAVETNLKLRTFEVKTCELFVSEFRLGAVSSSDQELRTCLTPQQRSRHACQGFRHGRQKDGRTYSDATCWLVRSSLQNSSSRNLFETRRVHISQICSCVINHPCRAYSPL